MIITEYDMYPTSSSVFWDSFEWWMMMNWRNSAGFEKLITLMLCSSGFCSEAKKIYPLFPIPFKWRIDQVYLKMRLFRKKESTGTKAISWTIIIIIMSLSYCEIEKCGFMSISSTVISKKNHLLFNFFNDIYILYYDVI